MGLNVCTVTDSPTADKVCPSPTSIPQINSSGREVSWTPPPKAQQIPPGKQRNNQLCLLCPAYQDRSGSAVSIQGCPQKAKMLMSCTARILRVPLPFSATCRTQHCKMYTLRSLGEDPVSATRPVCPKRVPPAIVSFLPPSTGEGSSALSRWSYRLNNICLAMSHAARAECRSRNILKCYLLFLSVAKKLWTDSLVPSSRLSLPVCLPHTLLLCPSPRAQSSQALPAVLTELAASKGYLHLWAGENPQMEGSRAISQTQQMCWQPQAFGYFHRETGKIGKI